MPTPQLRLEDIDVLLQAVTIANKRGAFELKEAGPIATAAGNVEEWAKDYIKRSKEAEATPAAETEKPAKK